MKQSEEEESVKHLQQITIALPAKIRRSTKIGKHRQLLLGAVE